MSVMERLPWRMSTIEHRQRQLLHAESPVPARDVLTIRPGPVFFFSPPPTPPPGGRFYLASSPTKNPEEEDTPRIMCTRCLESDPRHPGSWLGNLPNRKPTPEGKFPVINSKVSLQHSLPLKNRPLDGQTSRWVDPMASCSTLLAYFFPIDRNLSKGVGLKHFCAKQFAQKLANEDLILGADQNCLHCC